jgi:hypothetical protein
MYEITLSLIGLVIYMLAGNPLALVAVCFGLCIVVILVAPLSTQDPPRLTVIELLFRIRIRF